MHARYLLALAALATVPATAQLADASAATRAVCRSALAHPAPTPPTTGPLSRAQLTHCDETALYFGLGGSPPNLPAALQCGWYQRAHPDSENADLFRGPGILSMIYANGDGVPRDLNLATRFVCENPWSAPAEFDGRIDHLAHMRQALAAHTSPPPPAFNLCDDITSGLGEGNCALLETRRRADTRDRAIAGVLRQLPPAAQPLFPALQAAERRFEHTRANNEVDLSGTGRAAFALEEEDTLAQQFLINLQRFSRGDIPATTAADLTSIRKQLAQTLSRIQHAPASHWQYTTITPAGVGATQESYNALTAAWLRFAASAFPHLSPTDIEAQLLRLRLHQLRSLLAT